MSDLTVSAIIPSFNGSKWLVNLLPDLVPAVDEVIVVDGGSTDLSANVCERNGARMITLADNPGFPFACNAGAEAAKRDVLLFLNNDIKINTPQKEMIHRLIEGLTDDCAAVAPAGCYFTPNFGCLGETMDPEARVDYLPFWCVAIREDTFWMLGGLDEKFGMGYSEDADFAIRAETLGLKLKVVPTGIVHLGGGGATAKEMGINMDSLFDHCQANIDYLMRKHHLPKILVVRLDAFGDVLMTAPAVKAIKKKYPHSRICWLVAPECADCIDICDAADVVLRRGRPETEWTLLNTRFDLLFNFNDYPLDIEVSMRQGGGRVYGSYILEELVRLPNQSQFVSKIFHNKVWRIGKALTNQRKWHALTAGVEIDSEIAPIARRYCVANPKVTLPPGPLVAMHGSCGSGDAKLMPPDLFYEIADRLVRHGLRPVVIGNSPEFDGVYAELTRPLGTVDLVGELTVVDLPAVLYRCVGCISTDSFIRHLAVGCGIPTLCIFTAANSKSCGDYGPGHIDVLPNVPCAPCWEFFCPLRGRANLQCWKVLDAESIVDAFVTELPIRRRIQEGIPSFPFAETPA